MYYKSAKINITKADCPGFAKNFEFLVHAVWGVRGITFQLFQPCQWRAVSDLTSSRRETPQSPVVSRNEGCVAKTEAAGGKLGDCV